MKITKISRLWFVLMALILVLPQSLGLAGAPLKGNTVLDQELSSQAKLLAQPSLQAKDGKGGEEEEDDPFARADWYYGMRLAGDPNAQFTMEQASQLRAQAAANISRRPEWQHAPAAFGGAWSSLGPNPIVQLTRTTPISAYAVSGRIGALAIRSTSPYTMYLGAAQGGVWISSTLTTQWEPMTDQLPSLAIGAIALAPSNEDIVYVGTGEGALSGDSYYGNGVLKSTDGGNTFTHISGYDYFHGVSISKMAVDSTNPDVVYATVLSGIAGNSVYTRPPYPTPYGVWKSTDGGIDWSGVLTTTNPLNGATDLVMDPLDPNVLYASFWGQGISMTVDGGLNWSSVMMGFPVDADYTAAPTRFALGISHPSAAISATLYTGFEWYDTLGTYHPSTVWKSSDAGQHWVETNTDVVGNYCGEQCWYDNVIGVDPSDPDIVYALGLFNYDTGAGGIFRSMDGGANWLDIGYGLHPDYHAIAIRKDAPENIVIGNDGGVWRSSQRGGRLNPADPLSAVDWINLNGQVDPASGDVIGQTGLQITQFESMDQHPTNNRVYGGTQDNGTLRKFNNTAQSPWYDFPSGDGGQVLVDPSNPNYVYSTYYGISPYRFTDGMSDFYSNEMITTGLDRSDRSAFYIPWIMDPANPNRLYLGSYRVYRTDSATAASSSDVVWTAISADLTSGCTSGATSPTGFRCVITAFGVTAGAPAVYVGTGDGRISLSTDADSVEPAWARVDKAPLPVRPVSALAVDRSNYRIAYVAYSGFDEATPGTPGHVFKTTDGGNTWTNISSNLPDVPVNTIILNPSDPQTVYVGTDVGPLVTTDGGASWDILGIDFPIDSVAQLSLNPFTRRLVAGTHGRGAFSLTDNTTQIPALEVGVSEPGLPYGPGTLLTYAITVQNSGSITATGVSITDTIPAHTTFVAAGSGGVLSGSNVVWHGLTAPLGTVNDNLGLDKGSVTVTLTVHIDSSGVGAGDVITNDGIVVTSVEGAGATGSPYPIILRPANAVTVTPASQLDGARSGTVISYTVTIRNMGYLADDYQLAASGNDWPTTFWNTNFTAPISQTPSIVSGATYQFGVRVTIPGSAANNTSDTATVAVTSNGNSSATASTTIQTIAVTDNLLLVDNDGDIPDVQGIYRAALDAGHYQYNIWDLVVNPVLPPNYLKAHKAVVWFTGQTFPGPLLPYESELAAFLDGGGRLFMSGQDILDQSAGTTPFVHDYLHVNWDGSETQNDTGALTVTAVTANPVTGGLGSFAMDFATIGFDDFADQITPVDPANAAFVDDQGEINALTVEEAAYKVVFLAFPFEAMGTPADRAELIQRVLKYFGNSPDYKIYLPIAPKNAMFP